MGVFHRPPPLKKAEKSSKYPKIPSRRRFVTNADPYRVQGVPQYPTKAFPAIKMAKYPNLRSEWILAPLFKQNDNARAPICAY